MRGEATFSERQLTDPQILMRPMSPSNWFLRTMILEFERRGKVLAGRVDPTPGEPWLVCSPEDLKAWLKAHKAKA